MKKILLLMILAYSAMGYGQKMVTVSQAGNADYKTVQEAIDAVQPGNAKAVAIFIKNGIYKERIIVDSSKRFLTLIGEDKDKTILTFNNHTGTICSTGDTVNTWTSASFFVYADDFKAENITFENNAGFTAGQAVALRVEGSRASFFNCRMIGFQDVLFLSGSGVKHYFKDCYIEGTTDFIFGAATAVFQNCHIHSKKNSHVTAASTPATIPYGFVFFNCNLTASDSTVNKVSLGRPWRPAASVTYLNCRMDNHIIPEGWNNWKNPANEATARFAEYHSTGPGANPSARYTWTKQLTGEEARLFTPERILGNWKPYLPEPK
jgi:pectinesterase